MTGEPERLAALGIVRIRAENPGPLTLSGTNTWIVGSPAVVVDPGPELGPHVEAVAEEAARRGGAAGVVLTHRHADHDEAAAALAARLGVPVAAAHEGDIELHDGAEAWGLRAIATPGHADDHLAFISPEGACFTGDAVLGEGSVFISARLGEYLAALERLRTLRPAVLCPGHGPAIWDAEAKLAQYVAHRLERERRLLAALAEGLRTEADLLDAAWADAPPMLRPAAAITLRAHLEKLAAEGRLPDDWPPGQG